MSVQSTCQWNVNDKNRFQIRNRSETFLLLIRQLFRLYVFVSPNFLVISLHRPTNGRYPKTNDWRQQVRCVTSDECERDHSFSLKFAKLNCDIPVILKMGIKSHRTNCCSFESTPNGDSVKTKSNERRKSTSVLFVDNRVNGLMLMSVALGQNKLNRIAKRKAYGWNVRTSGERMP